MNWTHVEQDWSGFLGLVRQMLPFAELKDCAACPSDLDGFSSHLAAAADLTQSEARDLVLTRILPIWASGRAALAA